MGRSEEGTFQAEGTDRQRPGACTWWPAQHAREGQRDCQHREVGREGGGGQLTEGLTGLVKGFGFYSQ